MILRRQVTLLAFAIKDYTTLNEAQITFIKFKVAGKTEEVGYSPFHLMKETIMITILQYPPMLPAIIKTSPKSN